MILSLMWMMFFFFLWWVTILGSLDDGPKEQHLVLVCGGLMSMSYVAHQCSFNVESFYKFVLQRSISYVFKIDGPRWNNNIGPNAP